MVNADEALLFGGEHYDEINQHFATMGPIANFDTFNGAGSIPSILLQTVAVTSVLSFGIRCLCLVGSSAPAISFTTATFGVWICKLSNGRIECQKWPFCAKRASYGRGGTMAVFLEDSMKLSVRCSGSTIFTYFPFKMTWRR